MKRLYTAFANSDKKFREMQVVQEKESRGDSPTDKNKKQYDKNH